MIKLKKSDLIGVSALLVHAAKIDENYTDSEKNLILKFIKENNSDMDHDKILLRLKT